MEAVNTPADVLFILLGAIMVLAMHAGFAFLEVGTVRKKNQVNALVKILCDFSISTIAYFLIGYTLAYGSGFLVGATTLAEQNGYQLVKFFFLLTFAAAIPAIISGGIAERAKFYPQLFASAALVALVYPFFEGIVWNGNFGVQDWLTSTFGAPMRDFAGSVVVHGMGGWIALSAVLLLGARRGRYKQGGGIAAHPPSSIPFLALGAWMLTVGWFGFNVMSAQAIRSNRSRLSQGFSERKTIQTNTAIITATPTTETMSFLVGCRCQSLLRKRLKPDGSSYIIGLITYCRLCR